MSAHAVPTPIGPVDRVSDVLARDETLVDVFVRHSPHFEKLRNRTLRRVMAPLVTVEQAARVAGVAVDVLLRDLNDALGALAPADTARAGVPPQHASASTVPAAAHHPADRPTVELDLREDMRAGREPFSRIMAAVRELDDTQVLRLRTIFEPVPLFAVLAKRGFNYESRQDAPEDWSVRFWRGAADDDAVVAEPAPTPDDDDRDRENTLWLDVRGLEPPQPMLRTLAALEALPAGHELVQINVRVPQLLLPVLAERGYAVAVDESHADRVLVRIWRPVA